jgi:PAS domain S-box-containing protein
MMEEICKKCGNILIVDDNPMNIRLLSEMLKNEGYNTWPAPNGVRALAVLEKHAIDLILLDIKMPDMDGYEVCEKLKSNIKTTGIPVIFISALSQTIDKLKAFEVGGVDYITKPFEEQEVLVRIQTQLTILEQQRKLHVLIESSFEGILIHVEGKIVEFNQQLLEMLDYSKDEFIKYNAFDLLTPASREITKNHIQTNFDQAYAVEAVKRDGTILPVDVKGKKVTWHGCAARVITVRDMSWRTFLRKERRAIDIVIEDDSQFGELVGKSDMMKKVYEYILRAAVSDSPVLIKGETGSGKELTARTIFKMSENYNNNFVPVNCASIPEHLFESLFFGHKKGAFTGADNDHTGYFEQAEGGTLFLDEVGELSIEKQVKLLRVLNDFTYTPVGGIVPKIANIRLITATNRDLRKMIDRKKVRNDFFHRIYVLSVELPALRWHKDDIDVLIAHYLKKTSDKDGPRPQIPLEIMDQFMDYDWPGNVRELFNEVERFLATGEVDLSGHLPQQDAGNGNGPVIDDNLPLNKAIEEFEKFYIPRSLELHEGHRGKTSESLHVDRKTLYRKLKKFGLD